MNYTDIFLFHMGNEVEACKPSINIFSKDVTITKQEILLKNKILLLKIYSYNRMFKIDIHASFSKAMAFFYMELYKYLIIKIDFSSSILR